MYSITFSQTKDCNDLSGDYVCIESRVIQNQEKINWCWDCYYGVYWPSKYVDPYAFVWGGYFAAVYYLSPSLAYLNYHIGWFSSTEVPSNACGPNVNIPVWIGEAKYWVFYVRENKITSKWSVPWFFGCKYPSLSPEIVLLEGTFECPGGPNLERDAKYLREIKYGKGACDEDKCKCVDFPPINQCNLPCSREKYDKREKNFCSLGCALSSLVSVMQYVGCNVDPCDVNKCNECFDDKGNVKWDVIIRKYCPDKLRFVERKDNCPRTIDEWRAYCSNDQFAILQMQILRVNPSRQEGQSIALGQRPHNHFVVFRCVDEKGNILTMDPAYDGRYRPADCKGMRIFSRK